MPDTISTSIVLYKPDPDIVGKAIQSVLASPLVSKLYLLDNSPSKSNKLLVTDDRVEYIFNRRNLGFGAAHNIALTRSMTENHTYHLVMNPDVYFGDGTIEKICDFMDSNSDVGLLTPKVLYPDGSTQYLCKLLPSPWQLMLRRFLPLKRILDERNKIYELRFTSYDRIMDVPYLSGCFMFLRTKVLKDVGLFDERFFLYFEDVDLCRRINSRGRTVYFPHAVICHHYQKGSYKKFYLLRHHLVSAIKYFRKWGAFFDGDRRQINLATLCELGYSGR